MTSDSIHGGTWDVAGNWSNGLPATGDAVTATGNSIDNIGSLSLSSLTLEGTQSPPLYLVTPASVIVTGNALAIGTLSGDLQFSLYAGDPDGSTTSSVMVAVGTVSASTAAAEFGAFGSAATLIIPANVNAAGGVLVGDGGTVVFTGTQSPSAELGYEGGTFAFENPGTVVNSLFNGFNAGDAIEVPGTAVDSVTYNYTFSAASLTVVTNDGTYSFPNLYSSAPSLSFTEAVDPRTGLEAITAHIPCYAAGTLIATATGQVPIEALRVGDLVLTADGSRAPIRWIGHRRIDLRRHPAPARVTPIRIARDAFGPGLPWRDLLLSPDHAVYVDGVLIPIRYLCDGESIAPAPCDTITYFHLELPRHDVLLANGLPAESYLDAGSRAAFDNGGRVVQAHPDFVSRAWEAEGCAPLVIAGPVLDAVRARLRAISRQRAGTRQYQFG